jgi:hypothetical protein
MRLCAGGLGVGFAQETMSINASVHRRRSITMGVFRDQGEVEGRDGRC